MAKFLSASFAAAAHVILALTCLAAPAIAQTPNGTILTGKDVTEQNVVDALMPDKSGDASTVRTRGIRATIRTDHAADGGSGVRKKASAILLITFETNSTELTARSKQELDVVAKAMHDDRLSEFTFDIEGHADARGSPTANQVLSQQRAEAARRYLVDERQIAESRLRAIGKGDTEPMNRRDVAAPENRRVAVTTVVR